MTIFYKRSGGQVAHAFIKRCSRASSRTVVHVEDQLASTNKELTPAGGDDVGGARPGLAGSVATVLDGVANSCKKRA